MTYEFNFSKKERNMYGSTCSYLKALFVVVFSLSVMYAKSEEYHWWAGLDGIEYRQISETEVEVTGIDYLYRGDGHIVVPSTVRYTDGVYNEETGEYYLTVDKTFRVVRISGLHGDKIKSVSIPNSVTSIGSFSECTGLTTINIPNSVTSIGDYAFYNCKNLKTVKLPNSITEIGYLFFYGCSSLESIVIPNGVKSIDWTAFDGCNNLASVTFLCPKVCKDWFYNKAAIKELIIGKDVRTIEASAFWNFSSLTSVKIENGLETIEGGAFRGCEQLQDIELPNSLTSIGGSAFEGCISLKSIRIPDNVKIIENFTFKDCKGLSTVSIGESVEEIERDPFTGCENVEKVYCYAKEPPICDYSLQDWSTIIFVPKESIGKYKKADIWKY